MQLGEPQAKIVQIKNISTLCTGQRRCRSPASGHGASGSGEAAVVVVEAVPFMAPYVIPPSSFYLKLSHVGASSLASAVAQKRAWSRR